MNVITNIALVDHYPIFQLCKWIRIYVLLLF